MALLLTCLISDLTWARPPSHGFSYFGDLKYPADMVHFDFVNPDAPRGGKVTVPGIGSFNNLHPYSDKGIAPYYLDLLYDPLMRPSQDELASWYGWLAETVETADDFSWVEYTLRRNAAWHDGKPLTVEDVVWTFEAIKTQGSPSLRSSYRDIEAIKQTGPWSFRFIFADAAEKTPQLVIQTTGFSPVPKHYWERREFDATTMQIPLGSGPYRIGEIDAGSRIILERVPGYWAKDLNIAKGYFNFDQIEVIYFFDESVMVQALRAGVLDYYREQNESNFATAYNFPGADSGLFKKETYTMGQSYGMHYAVVFNLRKPLFADIQVREALTLAYNFEWANRVYWHSGMDRNNSYFMRSGMQAKGLPSGEELRLLEQFRDEIPARVFTHPVPLPRNESFGRNRETLIQADQLLQEAGWVVRDFVRVNAQTGERLAFEFVISYAEHERMLVPFVDNLKRLGIDAKLKKVETNLMVNRMRTYDFDATMRKVYTFKLPYPRRIRNQFTSDYADRPNMMNYGGIQNPVVDALVEAITGASSEAEMNIAGRALDRVLLWNFYVIPEGHPVGRHLVYWDRLGHPPLGVEHMNWTAFPYLWWFDEAKSARVDAGLSAMQAAGQ